MNFSDRNKEKELSQYDYERFQTLILSRTGMIFGPRRRKALAHGVLKMQKKTGCADLDDCYNHLFQSATDSNFWEDLIDEITVGETYFFRDTAQMNVLRQHIFPELISRHQHDRRLRIWCAGCASGEEPYTLAILLSELLADLEGWNIFILATDINKRVLEKARKGIFRDWSFRQTDPLTQTRYFRPQKDAFQIVPWMQEIVTFGYQNLSENSYPSLATNTNALDLILCRNVAIYQSEAVIEEVVRRFHSCLLSGGWLMVGAAETSIPVYGQFAARSFPGTTVFQKIAEPIQVSAQPVSPRKERLLAESITSRSVRPEASHSAQIAPASRTETAEPSHFYEEGLELLKKKRFDAALNSFQTCIAMDSTYTQALFQLGKVHANLGHLEEARSWCHQAIEQDPLMVVAHYTLALIHQEEGAHEEAVRRLTKALFLDADFILGHFSLSILYRQTHHNEKSERHRRQAIRLASGLEPDTILPGSDDLTAAQLLTMAKALG